MKNPQDIVITAVSALTPIGLGFAELKKGLRRGEHRIGDVGPTLFPQEPAANGVLGGALVGFDPKAIIAAKGLRYMDRNTLIVLSCIKLDLEAQLSQLPDRNNTALVVGTTFGSLRSQIDFPVTFLNEGFKALNAMDFPNTVINAPPSQGNAWYGLTHSSTTISNAFTGGLDALIFAADGIRNGQMTRAIAGGADEFSLHCAAAFAKHNLASTKGHVRPFDDQRDGTLIGEGAALFMMETRGSAQARQAPILAEILGYGSSFDGSAAFSHNPSGEGAITAMQLCLNESGVAPKDVSFIAASANGSLIGDRAEAHAIQQVFGNSAKNIPIVAYKSYWGECFGASGAMQVAAALADLQDQIISSTCGYASSSEGLSVTTAPTPISKGGLVMINAFGYTGHNSALMLRIA